MQLRYGYSIIPLARRETRRLELASELLSILFSSLRRLFTVSLNETTICRRLFRNRNRQFESTRSGEQSRIHEAVRRVPNRRRSGGLSCRLFYFGRAQDQALQNVRDSIHQRNHLCPKLDAFVRWAEAPGANDATRRIDR